MSAPPTTSSGPAPQRRTAVSRGLIKIVLITFIVVVLGFVVVRRLAGIAPESAAEARAKKEEQERAAKEAGNPFAVQRLIADQLRDRLARNDDEPPARATAPTQEPAAEPTKPTRTETDAKRIEEHRNTATVSQHEDLSGVEIGFWEAQDQDEGQSGTPALSQRAPSTPESTLRDVAAVAAAAGIDASGFTRGTSPGIPPDGQPANTVGQVVGPQGNARASGGAAGSIKPPLFASAAPSPYYIREGWIIPAVIQQSLNTDAPGTFRAMVTSDVYDSLRGEHLLIERGTALTGEVSTDVAEGQSRMIMSVNRMDFPSGGRVALGGWDISDRTGAAGIAAKVDDHFWERFGSAFGVAAVAALAGRYDNSQNVTINVGSGSSNNGNATSTLTGTAGQALSDTVRQILQRNQSIKRTLTLEPADKINIVVARDLVLDPNIVRSY
ncbi:MAG: TrbI/VirB10 family protein [Achromobacter sp.]|jgi:type IV secretion system protein VirB10|uniref:TrbI/VirB10 family protein n=1 Tax=Achromobacter TaxID=222 RepID=UPI0012C19438|nr:MULTISPECIES: TrbI/VirB10 family protein [Achromobacter]MPS81832.1 TrbI/VirB10 family protein [Achromobacter sp.]